MTQPLDRVRLHAAYAAGLDPVAVIDQTFAAIAAADDPGIFISLADPATARAAAAALPPFDPVRLPLWGIPFAVKDNIDVAGLPTTAGCPAFAYRPDAHATAVARAIAAGAIPVGKTNLDQFATGLVGVRTPYPVPRNAIDPALVPGGSSSGSAVAVARGLVGFALGTDTAGSGRVPAGLNNVVGLKPSLGSVSTAGVVPACRTLDCVSVFAGTVDDAWAVYAAIAGDDPGDPFARPLPLVPPGPVPPHVVVGVPDEAGLLFHGDSEAAAAWQACLADLAAEGCILRPVDMAPFFETARLLYEGPWVAERHAAMRDFLAAAPQAVHPVTRGIVEGAGRFSATDAFVGLYRLQALRAATAPVWQAIDMLAVPTAPIAPTLADLEADPLGPNARLGTYTNFVNLLDLAALAVPGRFRADGRAAGATLIGPRGSDGRLAALGRLLHARAAVGIGATGRPLPQPVAPVVADDGIELAVVGAHLSGMALNPHLVAAGGRFVRAGLTEPCYRLFALHGGPPHRPGLLRVAADGGAIAVEVWSLPPDGFARFVAAIPPPLGIGTLRLADGSRPKGFLAEPAGLEGARDITGYGGWRAYAASA